MDGKGFDALVRMLGASTGRRAAVIGVLAALRGGMGIVPEARAQALLGLGAACTSTDQCNPTATSCGPTTPVFCADNGYAEDGALNCCRFEGGACIEHSHCCAGLMCQNLDPMQVCSVGQCLPPNQQDPAALATRCPGTYYCEMRFGASECSAAGYCCSLAAGTSCYSDVECCGAMTCVGSSVSAVGLQRGYCG